MQQPFEPREKLLIAQALVDQLQTLYDKGDLQGYIDNSHQALLFLLREFAKTQA
jgi:hypothetical protein